MRMHPREVISGMRRWWQNWRGANSSFSELICCGKDEAERMAHDLVCLCLSFVGSRSMVLKQLICWPVEWLSLIWTRMRSLRLYLELSRTFSGSVQCVKATDSARETLGVIRRTRHGKIIARMLRC